MRSKLGPAKATTATAHKLAKIIYHMLKEHTPYRERRAADYLHKAQERQLRQLRKHAKHLGFDLVPQTSHEKLRRPPRGLRCIKNIPNDTRRVLARTIHA